MNDIADVLSRYFQCRSLSGETLQIEDPIQISGEILSEIFDGVVPVEIQKIYDYCNGFAIVDPNCEGGLNWILPKIGDLKMYMIDSKKWLSNTHPKIAKRYYPFLRYDGNNLGYLKIGPNRLDGSLYLFTHELYLNEAKQPWSQFLCRINENICSYLEYEMTFY